ncbi:hypothetical protein Bca52824_033071 [Brassica carinata]|uniref:Uncharacterized protein n=1 Tax=Brassica carinata TaxID=52824 RepID=A0A8X7SFC4_BRACI|nr:hypothetical protein Bca52824_033071 [Brassica carinata]
MSLFTRKQQKLLKKAREMSGTLDLSALLKGKLQLLKKSSTAGSPAKLSKADASSKELGTARPSCRCLSSCCRTGEEEVSKEKREKECSLKGKEGSKGRVPSWRRIFGGLAGGEEKENEEVA